MRAMTLSKDQKKYLRGMTHHLKPVILIGNSGLSDAVKAEIELALERHELIKVKLRGSDREARTEAITTIATEHRCELIHAIGGVASFYRRHPKKPKLAIPDS
ncbi:MAG: RNA-binding protein [Lysobacteraceae bacterium]|nr:MAG: RNA-binding protein [Xanthomonadaceae bacterium]